MYNSYNYSTLQIQDSKADCVAVKGKNTAVKLYSFIDGVATIDTADYAVGDYALQFFSGNQILKTDVLKIEQNLKYADDSYDPTSENKKILQAIKAYLGGVASHQQRKVKVGDKEIEYSSFEELIKWKNYYQIQVRKEQGKASGLRMQKLYYKGI